LFGIQPTLWPHISEERNFANIHCHVVEQMADIGQNSNQGITFVTISQACFVFPGLSWDIPEKIFQLM